MGALPVGGTGANLPHRGVAQVKYVFRILLVLGTVVVGSALIANLAFGSALVQTTLAAVGSQGLFIGLLTSGLVGALLTQEYWLTA
ncbi:hypothetical protein ATK74_0590 [Propionicimonas paludicola]|uniref:Uncharacterized protein n=1 Tax=Propionicimonas paludicola TaxID=185243 RepID=A0A2A9CPD7_9ACTN|nr:hypothetical protein ATK74_0590 [Propionicimonas paludicola]